MHAAIKLALIGIIAALLFTAFQSDSTDAGTTQYSDAGSLSELNMLLENGTSNIRITGDITIEGDVTVPAGTTLLLPFDESDTTGYRNGGECSRMAPDDPYCHVTLTIDGTLTVYGKVIIGSVIGCNHTFTYQGHVSSDHARIINSGTIILENGSELDSYGYLEGSGTLTAKSGSTVVEPLVVTDYIGADSLINMFDDKQGVFNRYALENVQCTFDVLEGSVLYGHLCAYAMSSYHSMDIAFIGQDNALISLSSDSWARLTYDPDKFIETDESLNLHKDIGKLTISLYGGGWIGSIKGKLEGYTFDLRDNVFSFPYNLDLDLVSGNYLLKTAYRILPGSTLTIEEDASLSVLGSLSAFWGLSDVEFKGMRYPSTEVLEDQGFSDSGRLVVKGGLYLLDGSVFNGIAEMASDCARIRTYDCNTSENFVRYGCNHKYPNILIKDYTRNLSTRIMSGFLVNSSGELMVIQKNAEYEAGAPATYVMNEYTQNDGKYTLGSEFKGGWRLISAAYTEIYADSEGDCISGTFVSNACGTQSGPIDLTISVPDTNCVTIEYGAINEILARDGQLMLVVSDFTFLFPNSALSGFTGDVGLILDAGQPNMKQKATAGDRFTINCALECNGEPILLVNGCITISLPMGVDKEEDLSKLQMWCIDEYGTATGFKATYSDGRVSFSTPHLGCYAASFQDVPMEKLDIKDPMDYIIVAAIVIGSLAVVAIAAYKVRKTKG